MGSGADMIRRELLHETADSGDWSVLTALGMPVVLALVLMTVGLPPWVEDACAHKVGVFAWVEGDVILVEGYFGGRTKAVNCTVTLQSSDGKKIAESKTGTDGVARFKRVDLPAPAGDVTVVLVAGEGHQADYVLRGADLPDGVKAASPSSDTRRESPTAKTDAKAVKASRAENPEALKQAIAAELKPVLQKLDTLERLMLKEQDKDPSMRDIVGGIGWILGLVGLTAYFMAGRRRKQL